MIPNRASLYEQMFWITYISPNILSKYYQFLDAGLDNSLL